MGGRARHDRSGAHGARCDAPAGLSLDDRHAFLVCHCARELLRNAVRHSGSTNVAISATGYGAALTLTVADNGSGFDPTTVRAAGHLGLELVEQALADEGGHLTLHSSLGAGTRVTVEVPHRFDGRPR